MKHTLEILHNLQLALGFYFLLLGFACFFQASVLECQEEGRVATGILSAHAVVRRSWGVIPLCVLVFQTASVFSHVIAVANRFSPEASRGTKNYDS